MRREEPKPNYDMLFQSAVYDLQSESIRDKIKNLEKRLIYANETVEKYRELRGEQG